MGNKVKIFVAEHCGPCAEVKQLLEDGKFAPAPGQEVELIDVETEEGFAQLVQNPVDGVPSAVDDQGRKCLIQVDDETGKLVLTCPADQVEEKGGDHQVP